MGRIRVQTIFLLSTLLCVATGPRAVAQSVFGVDGLASRLQARIDEKGLPQTRISAGFEMPDGDLWAFVDQDYSSQGVEVPRFGIATPAFDLGPLRESGLMSELNRPVGIGSITERSVVLLDRSLDPVSLRGGVIRFYGPASGSRRVELYGVSRGGTAPVGTKTGGATLTAELGRRLELDVGSKITLFGAQEEKDDWFVDGPESMVPSILRTGARLAFRGRRAAASVTAGASFSESTRPSPFVAGSVGISGGLVSRGESGRQLAAYSARLDAGAVGPGYTGDDGRYTTRTLLVHPVFSFRFPGLQFSGWYRWDLYRLPLLPVSFRRSLHAGSLDGEVHFGMLSTGVRLKPSLDFAEDGRALYRLSYSPRSRLRIGRLSLEADLQLTKSNVEELETGGHIALNGQWESGMATVSLDITDSLARLKSEIAVVGRRWRFAAAVTVPDAFQVDFARPSVAPNGSFAEVIRAVSCSLSFELLG